MTQFSNNPTVCCVLVPWKDDGLVLIRRGLREGFGKLALPGGFCNFKESISAAAARELREETGIDILPSDLVLIDGKTDEWGHNVLFWLYSGAPLDYTQAFKPDMEVLEVVVVNQATETCYPFHTEQVAEYFELFDAVRAMPEHLSLVKPEEYHPEWPLRPTHQAVLNSMRGRKTAYAS